jgi:hypothetical protein
MPSSLDVIALLLSILPLLLPVNANTVRRPSPCATTASPRPLSHGQAGSIDQSE